MLFEGRRYPTVARYDITGWRHTGEVVLRKGVEKRGGALSLWTKCEWGLKHLRWIM